MGGLVCKEVEWWLKMGGRNRDSGILQTGLEILVGVKREIGRA